MEPTSSTTEEAVPAGDDSDRRTVVRVVAAALVALIIGAAAGFVVGWKVEQSRAESDIENTRPIGTVSEVSDDTVTIRSGGERRVYAITDDTVVSTAETSDAGEIERGARVMVRNRSGDGGRVAIEIVVLPGDES